MNKFNEIRLKIALVLAGVGSLFSVIGWITYFSQGAQGSTTVAGVGMVLGIISYLFGGLLAAIRIIFNIATWGLVVAPVPVNLILFVYMALFALLVFLCLPIIPVYRTAQEHGLFL